MSSLNICQDPNRDGILVQLNRFRLRVAQNTVVQLQLLVAQDNEELQYTFSGFFSGLFPGAEILFPQVRRMRLHFEYSRANLQVFLETHVLEELK